MGRSTKEDALVLAEFAVAQGIAVRTARNYRAEGRPEWVAFLRGRGRVARAAGADAPRSDLQRARQVADENYKLLRQLQRDAAGAEDAVTRAAAARGVREARRAWEDARRDAERLEEAAGQLVPVAAVREVWRRGVTPLGSCMRTFANNVAGDLPPEWRPRFFAAVKREQVNWNASVAALDASLEGLMRGHD